MISHDKNVIIHSIQELMSVGQVFEIRALGVTRAYGSGTDNFSGFFQFDGGNAAEIADQVLKIKSRQWRIHHAKPRRSKPAGVIF